jgi:hypothetical protein
MFLHPMFLNGLANEKLATLQRDAIHARMKKLRPARRA